MEYNKLTAIDLTLAKQKVVTLVQRQSFPDEIRDLRRQESNGGTCRARVESSSSIVKLKLVCKDRIIRVSGRISEAPITFDAKNQITNTRSFATSTDNLGIAAKNNYLDYVESSVDH